MDKGKKSNKKDMGKEKHEAIIVIPVLPPELNEAVILSDKIMRKLSERKIKEKIKNTIHDYNNENITIVEIASYSFGLYVHGMGLLYKECLEEIGNKDSCSEIIENVVGILNKHMLDFFKTLDFNKETDSERSSGYIQ